MRLSASLPYDLPSSIVLNAHKACSVALQDIRAERQARRPSQIMSIEQDEIELQSDLRIQRQHLHNPSFRWSDVKGKIIMNKQV